MNYSKNTFMKIITIIVLCLFLNSCKKQEGLEKYDKNGNLIVYSEQVYSEMWVNNKNLKVTVIDTFCINQKSKAIKDIKNGKLIYYGDNNKIFEKLSNKLSKYGIESKEFLGRDVRLGGFEPYCYQNEMEEAINRKFGRSFIDSLSEVAKKEFVLENPNIEYMEDGIDLREKYNVKK
jgi:hypothetical protein